MIQDIFWNISLSLHWTLKTFSCLASNEDTWKVQGLSKSVGLTCHRTGNNHSLILCVQKDQFYSSFVFKLQCTKAPAAAGCASYGHDPNEAINQVLEQKHIMSPPHPQKITYSTVVHLKLLQSVCANSHTMSGNLIHTTVKTIVTERVTQWTWSYFKLFTCKLVAVRLFDRSHFFLMAAISWKSFVVGQLTD